MSLAQKVQSDKRDVEQIAAYRSRRGADISERLKRAAQDADSVLGLAVAHRVRRCADEYNLWTAKNLNRADDTAWFDGLGQLWSCGSRLCLSCCATLASVSRRKARAGVERLETLFDKKTCFREGLRWRSLVLTMPLMVGADVTDAISRINDAFRRLTNRQFWKSRVRGGVKGVEFTVRPDGYHAHIHLLVLSEFLPINAERERESRNASGNLQAEMAHCLRAAGAHVNGELALAVYDVRRQHERKTGESVTLEKAVLETTKYLTKTESWDEIADGELVKVAEVARWPRMFELLGEARPSKRENAARKAEAERKAESATLVHTPPLSNGETDEKREPTWRAKLAVVTDLASWKKWQKWQDEIIRRTQQFRRTQLALKFPQATFSTLSGEKWSGETIEATPKYNPPYRCFGGDAAARVAWKNSDLNLV